MQIPSRLWSAGTTMLFLCTTIAAQNSPMIKMQPTQRVGTAAAPRAPIRPAQPGRAPKIDLAKFAGRLKLKSSTQVNNPAVMSSPILMTLQQQKQAADIESGQIMSAQGGTTGGISSPRTGMAIRPGLTLAGRTTTNAKSPSRFPMGAAMTPTTICMGGMVGIQAVNQKKMGVVFTPDSRYDLYTITGCGFGSTPGKIYLQGGSGAFPAHNGKITLAPVDPKRGWTDRAIIAKVDPSVTGELDQKNISLVVETSTGQRAQMNGFSFHAVRGPAFLMKQVPISDVTSNFGGTGKAIDYMGQAIYASPCYPWWGQEDPITDCTLKVFRQSAFATDKIVDTIAPKLKPGFFISSVMVQISTFKEDQGDVLNPYTIYFNGGTLFNISEHPYLYGGGNSGGMYYYGLKIWVYGPAGISDPLLE